MKPTTKLSSILIISIGALAISACDSSSSGSSSGSGTSASFADISKPVTEDTCIHCHNSSGIDQLVQEIQNLPDSNFTSENFPDTNFPAGLITEDTAALIASGEPDATNIDPAYPNQKSWILHELGELQGLLAETVPPTFNDQKAFDAFAVLGDAGAQEGCEIVEKLDLGAEGDAEGMAPLWAVKIMELLGKSSNYAALNATDRANIRSYVSGILTGGADGCSSTGGGSSS